MATIKANLRVKTETDYDRINLSSQSDIIDYDNTNSGLTATSEQGAIDELAIEKLDKVGDNKNNITTFTEASTLANIVSGESQATLWGKVKKFFSFIGTTTLTTTAQTVTTAINELVGINAYATGSPTYVADVTSQLVVINKASNQKNCSFSLTINASLPAYGIIFTLPTGFRPTSNEVFVCNIKNNATYQCAYIDVLTNGNIACSVALATGNVISAKITCV